MNSNHLSCFKAYDIRGRLGVELNAEIAQRIGRSTAEIPKRRISLAMTLGLLD